MRTAAKSPSEKQWPEQAEKYPKDEPEKLFLRGSAEADLWLEIVCKWMETYGSTNGDRHGAFEYADIVIHEFNARAK